MDTSDSEAFESADENFDNDINFKDSQSDSDDSDSNVKTVVVSSKKVTNEIDDISNLLDNLQVKFEHCRTVQDDDDSETNKTSVWDHEDLENLNTTTKTTLEETQSVKCSETANIQSGDLENLNVESSKITKFAVSNDVESSGWDDEDLENLNIEETTNTVELPAPEEVKSSQEQINTALEPSTVQCSAITSENFESKEKILTIDNSTKFAAPEEVDSSSWDEADLENLNIELKNQAIIEKIPSKFAATEDDVDTSGWDNDVDWEPIEDVDKVEKVSTGWDDFDTWDTIEDVKTSPQPNQTQSQQSSIGGGGWSAWGVTSLLSSATEGVTTFTSQVSQGLTTVLESSIGVPSPEELAKAQKLERDKLQETPQEDRLPQSNEISNNSGGVFGFGNLLTGVTHITKLVETTSSKVVNTGLDTLETIGKKTMEVLQEGDPGLVKKRALLGLNPDKPCLSQVLRDAKEKASIEDDAENAASSSDKRRVVIKKVHFETLFDDYQGLVHLEALEMLSKQCDIKLCTIIESMQDGSKELEDIQETMVQIKELCELPDEDDDDNNEQLQQLNELQVKLKDVVHELDLQTPITFTKLFEYWTSAEESMKIVSDVHEIHRMGIDTLAKITSLAVEQFHKCAELLLIKERRSTADEADSLVQITTILTALIGVIAAKYSEKLDSLSSSQTDNPDLNGLITNIFFEATQSSSYIQDAFQLFIPILQIGAV